MDRHSGDQSDAGEQTKQREHHAGQHGTRDRTVIIDGHDDPRRCDGKRPTLSVTTHIMREARNAKGRNSDATASTVTTASSTRTPIPKRRPPTGCQTVAGRIIDTERTHGQRGEPGSIRSAVPGG